MTIHEIQQQLVEEFEFIGSDWTEKYEYLIELGKALPPMSDSLKTEDRLIKGCQSRVWLAAQQENGIIHFQADSDGQITKGLIAMVVRVLNGQPAKAIETADLFFIERIGLRQHLSSTRSNGLSAMLQQIKLLAHQYIHSSVNHE